MGNRWIVLVNKSPKGPLTAEEIQALLAQNLIRRNDLAYEVIENATNERGGKATAQWKFLWQFDCFDRRKDEKLPEDPAKLTEAQRNRRQAPSEEQIKKEVEAALPLEFSSIQPEELVLKVSDKLKAIEEPERELAKFEAEENSFQSQGTESGQKGMWFGLGLVLVALGLGFGYLKNSKKGGLSVRQTDMALPLSAPENRDLALEGPPPPPPPPPASPEYGGNQSGSGGITSVILPKSKESKPDAGEIPLDEYRKLREERLEKERKEEEERLKAEQAAEEDEGDEEEGRFKKAKKKKKKRKLSAEEEEVEPKDEAEESAAEEAGSAERE